MKKDKLIGLISLALGIAAAIATMQIPIPSSSVSSGEPGPRLFPLIACVILILCGIGLLLQKTEDSEPFLDKAQAKRLLLLFAVFIFYTAGLQYLGFVITTPVMLFVVVTMFAGEKKIPLWVRILYAVGITAIIYIVFVVAFKTTIPSGRLLKLLK